MAEVHPVIQHIESLLGRIDPEVGCWHWTFRDGSTLAGAAFRDHPHAGATTVCSVGLGRHTLCSTRGHIHQEVLLACWHRYLSERLTKLVALVAEDVLASHIALSPGRVLGPAGPLIPNSGLEALLCLEPRLHGAALGVCGNTQPVTEFVWLVPITPAEAQEVSASGYEELFARWEWENVDLLDWHRA